MSNSKLTGVVGSSKVRLLGAIFTAFDDLFDALHAQVRHLFENRISVVALGLFLQVVNKYQFCGFDT